MKTTVLHEVGYTLEGDEGEIMLTNSPTGYARLVAVTIKFDGGKLLDIFALGRRCRKDGSLPVYGADICRSVLLTDPDLWVAAARQALVDSMELLGR